jgi:hypothetical protein
VITIRFQCGHKGEFDSALSCAPRCGQCGETTIRRVNAPAPRFTGMVAGPCATYTTSAPIAVSLASQPLTLKE